jgi:hypothetical protein
MCRVNELKLHIRCKTPEDPCIIYIQVKDKEAIGVCEKCWSRIASKDWEIGDGPKLTMEDILSEKSRVGDNPVLTEYKERGVKEYEPNKEEEDF